MTVATIANAMGGLYSTNTMPRKSDTTPAERAALKRRVRAGEWLRVGDAAKVLGISRTKMHMLVADGVVNHQTVPGSRYRECDPKDILRLLAESRRGSSGAPEAALDQSTHVDNDAPEHLSDTTSKQATNRRH